MSAYWSGLVSLSSHFHLLALSQEYALFREYSKLTNITQKILKIFQQQKVSLNWKVTKFYYSNYIGLLTLSLAEEIYAAEFTYKTKKFKLSEFWGTLISTSPVVPY